MATMLIAGERYEMPVWLKARLLEVQPTETENVLSVESGSKRGKFYRVVTDGIHAVSCPCDARIEQCAHVIAADRYLELERAQAQNEMDEAAVVAPAVLGEMAQDLDAHIDDELSTQDVPVAVWDGEGAYAYVLVGDLVEPVCKGSLDYFYPEYIVGAPLVYGSEVQRRLDAKRIVQRMSYRDLYAGDFNSVA